MRIRPHIPTVLLLVLATAARLVGQEQGGMRELDLVRSSLAWLDSRNAAGLGTLPIDRIAVMEGHFGKHDGSLAGIEESDNSLDAGACTEAFVKISDALALYGKLSYEYFRGRNMGGPLLMNPSFNPINFHECSDTTTGIKNREMFHLAGGISYSFSPKWSIGAKAGYSAGDQAKLKDPRALNVWMDLDVSAGFRFKASERFSIGFNIEYERALENLKGDVYGTTDKQYFTFIDYGSFYGSRELFDGTNGFVAVGETRPLFNSFYGGSIQIEAGNRTRFFNEVSFLRRSGYYGKRSSQTVTFTEHDGNIIEYNAVLLTGRKGNLHRVGLDFRYEGLRNAENIYRKNTEVGNQTVVEYFGQNEILKRTAMNAGLSYTGYAGVENYHPVWEYGAEAEMDMLNSLTTIYPFYRSSVITMVSVRLKGRRNITLGQKNLLTSAVEGCFMTGFGVPASDGTLASSTSDAPRSADVWLYRDFEYKTAMQAGGCLRLRYTRFFGAKIAFYVEAKDCFTHLLKKPEFLTGAYRNILETKVGIIF